MIRISKINGSRSSRPELGVQRTFNELQAIQTFNALVWLTFVAEIQAWKSENVDGRDGWSVTTGH